MVRQRVSCEHSGRAATDAADGRQSMTNPADPNQPAPGYPGTPPQGPPPPGYPPPPQGAPQQGYQPMPPPGQAGPPQGYMDRATQVAALPPLPPGTSLATAGKRIGTFLLAIVLAVVTRGIGYLIC